MTLYLLYYCKLTNHSFAIGCNVNNIYLIYIVNLHKCLDYIYYHYYVNTWINLRVVKFTCIPFPILIL